MQKRISTILHEMKFTNDCKKYYFFHAKMLRNEIKTLRFLSQKLRKTFANGSFKWVDFNSENLVSR